MCGTAPADRRSRPGLVGLGVRRGIHRYHFLGTLLGAYAAGYAERRDELELVASYGEDVCGAYVDAGAAERASLRRLHHPPPASHRGGEHPRLLPIARPEGGPFSLNHEVSPVALQPPPLSLGGRLQRTRLAAGAVRPDLSVFGGGKVEVLPRYGRYAFRPDALLVSVVEGVVTYELREPGAVFIKSAR
jgi:hypothetical protein